MKTGQFMCLGNLQHLKNRFSKGYEVQIKTAYNVDVQKLIENLTALLPGMEILDQHNEMLFCNIPFSNRSSSANANLSKIFQNLNRKKEEKAIETYSLTQTTLEQIFVQLAGEDEDAADGPVPQTTLPLNATNKNREGKRKIFEMLTRCVILLFFFLKTKKIRTVQSIN